MSELIRKLSRAAKRREGCHLTPEMVLELVNMRTIRRKIEVERRPPPPRTGPPVIVTTTLVRQIREMKAAEPWLQNRKIAAALGCSIATVQRYATEYSEKAARKRDRQRYEKQRQDPEWMRAKSEAALARYHAKKGESQCSV